MNLKDKTAIVTGASSGIGKAAALRLAQEGAHVCVNSLDDEEHALEVVKTIRDNGGDSFEKQADISNEDDVKALVEAVIDRWGRIDILINNAGISGAGTSFFEMDIETWNRMLKVNLTGVFLCCRAALPYMIEAHYGYSIPGLTKT